MANKQYVYVDHGGTTPVFPAVIESMAHCMAENWGNPSSVHYIGRQANAALNRARAEVASLIGAKPEQIYFTSGGTEADNLAILGMAGARREKGHIITSMVEHKAVLAPCDYLEKIGYAVTYLPVNELGQVSVEDFKRAIRKDTFLATIMMVNNEVGAVMPIKQMAAIAKQNHIVFHTDAVQAVGKIPVNVNDLGVDMLTMSSHKINGPKGAGALFKKNSVHLAPRNMGGGQEHNLRGGTENMPGFIGFGEAARITRQIWPTESKRLKEMQDYLIERVLTEIPDTVLNGPRNARAPHNLNFGFKYVDSESLLLQLDAVGISASIGSACNAGGFAHSHVLEAMGAPREISQGSLRITLGMGNSKEQMDYIVEMLKEKVAKLRQNNPHYVPKES